MEIDKESFRKLFPNLYREMELRKMSISMDAIRLDEKEAEEEASRPREPAMPTPIDYLRRCDNDDEAIEVIDYLERRGEVSAEQAEKLRKQVREHGVRSFGKKREWGYYSTKYLGGEVEE